MVSKPGDKRLSMGSGLPGFLTKHNTALSRDPDPFFQLPNSDPWSMEHCGLLTSVGWIAVFQKGYRDLSVGL